jgi:hypothetical protein
MQNLVDILEDYGYSNKLTVKNIGSFLCGINWELALDPFSEEFLNNVAHNGEESKPFVAYLQEQATMPAEDIVSDNKEFVRQGPYNDDLSHDTFWKVEGEEMILRVVIPGSFVMKQLKREEFLDSDEFDATEADIY